MGINSATEQNEPAKTSAGILWFNLLKYHWENMCGQQKIQLLLIASVLLMSQSVKILFGITTLSFAAVLLAYIFVQSPILNLIGGIGVGILAGATFILWVLKDIINHR